MKLPSLCYRFRMNALISLCALLAFAGEPAKGVAPMKRPAVEMKTTLGTITIELDAEKAPGTVQNFLHYVKDKFFDNTVFHRVISDFMIQGGGHDIRLERKPTLAPIKNEAANGLKNVKGTIAMARTGDPNSATAQFFINVKDNTMLDYKDDSQQGIGYCVFGRVTDGMDVVEKIKAVPTGNRNGMQNVPMTNVVIESVRLKP
jgi:cyclophilin family peptidyl-prolyl cis-trans isomerase